MFRFIFFPQMSFLIDDKKFIDLIVHTILLFASVFIAFKFHPLTFSHVVTKRKVNYHNVASKY